MALTYDVLVVDGLPLAGPPTPDGFAPKWSPTAVTLVSSSEGSVLVDGLLTRDDGRTLVDWIEAHDTPLEAIYVTHGHGDHFFSLGPVLDRFPNARLLARPEVIREMGLQYDGPMFEQFWVPLFGDKLPERIRDAEPVEDAIELANHRIEFVPAGHSDTVDTTFVHVPDLGLVVAGDIVYNGVYPYVVQTDVDSRVEWRQALDLIGERAPTAVVAGHKNPESNDDPAHVGATRQFLSDFDEALAAGSSAEDTYRQLVEMHPDRINRGALWSGVLRQTKLRDRSATA